MRKIGVQKIVLDHGAKDGSDRPDAATASDQPRIGTFEDRYTMACTLEQNGCATTRDRSTHDADVQFSDHPFP
jgi:hypothetical protein